MKLAPLALFLLLATSATAYMYNQDTTYINYYPSSDGITVFNDQYGMYYNVGNTYDTYSTYYRGYIPRNYNSCIGSGCGKTYYASHFSPYYGYPYGYNSYYGYNTYSPGYMPNNQVYNTYPSSNYGYSDSYYWY